MTDLAIRKGETFTRVLRWESLPLISTAITGITRAAPAVVSAALHGRVTGQRVAVVSAGGMRQINAKNYPPRSGEFHQATVLTNGTLSLGTVNSTGYSAYTSGGFLVSYTPATLAGFLARMQIRETVDAEDTLVSLTTANGGITLDDANHTITVLISATDTAALDFTDGVYDLEMVSGAGIVTRLLSGSISVDSEVTR